MNQTDRVRLANRINAAALLLAFFGYSLSPWLGTQSGLALLIELGDFLRTSAPGAQIGRQQAIFAILLGVLLCLGLQSVAFFLAARRSSRRYLAYEIFLALLGVVMLVVLLVAYQAQTMGVLVTAAAMLLSAMAGLVAYMGMAATPVPASKSEPMQEGQAEIPADPMLAFQRQVAQRFHQARSEDGPFVLGMMGIRYYDEVLDAFGDEAAQEMLDQLSHFIRAVAPNAVTTSFSTGAVMVALTGMTKADTQEVVAKVTERMVNRGFPGEMLLPAGRIFLDSFVVSFPEDGDNLARLTENVLAGYAEIVSIPYAER